MAGSAFKFGKFNYSVNNITAAAGTTTLLNSSDYYQYVTGTTTQTIKLPDATTMVPGVGFAVVNASSGLVTIVDNGNNVLGTVQANLSCEFIVDDASTANGVWMQLKGAAPGSSFIVATGGTITTDGNFKVHTFTSSGTFQILSGSGNIDSLVVAGGGGGASGSGGGGAGGGAGGLIYTTGTSMIVGSYSVTVGAGGSISPQTNGGNSSFNGNTAIGGGAQINGNGSAGTAGGSGSGGGFLGGAAGAGTSGQGNAGGTGGGGQPPFAGGGGGGAGAVGGNFSGSTGGAGGNGLSNSITGSAVTYAGGGGGGSGNDGFSGTGGAGGSGGGGHGGNTTADNGTAGTNGLGGGGGGGQVGHTGGSGVVIIRYQFQ